MKHFARAAFAATFALAVLGGCAQLEAMRDAIHAAVAAKVSQKEAYLAADAFDVIEITSSNYLRLKICTSSSGPICREPALTPRIEAALLSGRDSRNKVKAYLRLHQNDGADAPIAATDDLNVMTAATETLKALLGAYIAARGA